MTKAELQMQVKLRDLVAQDQHSTIQQLEARILAMSKDLSAAWKNLDDLHTMQDANLARAKEEWTKEVHLELHYMSELAKAPLSSDFENLFVMQKARIDDLEHTNFRLNDVIVDLRKSLADERAINDKLGTSLANVHIDSRKMFDDLAAEQKQVQALKNTISGMAEVRSLAEDELFASEADKVTLVKMLLESLKKVNLLRSMYAISEEDNELEECEEE